MSSRLHVDDSLELKLINISEYDDIKKDFVTKQRQFNSILFYKKYGKHFKSVPYFSVTEDELFHASKCIDEWAESDPRYKELWAQNIIPKDFYKRENFPATLRPWWEVFYKLEQNKWCNYQVLNRKISGFEDVDIDLFAGFKATSPWSHDNKVLYRTLRLRGKMKDVDRLIKDYRE